MTSMRYGLAFTSPLLLRWCFIIYDINRERTLTLLEDDVEAISRAIIKQNVYQIPLSMFIFMGIGFVSVYIYVGLPQTFILFIALGVLGFLALVQLVFYIYTSNIFWKYTRIYSFVLRTLEKDR